MNTLKLERTNSSNSDFQSLITKLDLYLAEKDGDDAPFFAALNTVTLINHVIVAYEANIAVGCGAIKKYDKDHIEIKRMFVEPSQRNKGVAKAILKELQTWSKELNYDTCILETGVKMTEAIELYKKEGFLQIHNYGPYKNIEESVCFKKHL